MNPKALQYIMGHANIAMTLNYYAHATFDSAMAEMKRLNKEKQQERLVAQQYKGIYYLFTTSDS